VVLGESQNFYNRVNMPLSGGGKFFTDLANLVAEFLLKLRLDSQEISKKLLNDRLDVFVSCDFVDKVQSLLFYNQIVVFQTV
jgi:adenine specific DNA methylase Mod